MSVVIYQPSSTESDKLSGLDKFESIASEATTKRNGVIFLSGDTNVDIIPFFIIQLAASRNDGK